MRSYETIVTRKGQITIPAAIRKALKIAEGDRVQVELDGDQVKLRRSQSVVERTRGALKGDLLPEPSERERAHAEAAIAEETVRRSHAGEA